MRKCNLCGSNCDTKLFEVRKRAIVKCDNCGLTRTRAKSFNSYEEYHRDKAEYTKDEEIFRNIFLKRHEIISKFIKKPGKILDVGSSTGTLLSIFKEDGWEVWGIEPSRSALYARKRGIKTTKNTFEKTKLPKNYFDLVVMNHTLEHVKNPAKVLQKVELVLKQGGIAYVDVPNFDGLDSRIKGRKWGYLMPEEHVFHYAPRTLSKLMEKAGLEVIWLKTWSGIFDVKNPLRKFWYDFTHLRLAFVRDMVIIPFNLLTTLLNRGSSLAVIGKKS